jgi:hypothetical protein
VVVLALLLALLCVPTVAGLTAWGLAGGDGTPETPLLGVLALLVGAGSLYNALICYLALFGDRQPWQWWLMWVAPVAGAVGLALAARTDPSEDGATSATDVLVGLGMQAVVGVPAVLLALSDAV